MEVLQTSALPLGDGAPEVHEGKSETRRADAQRYLQVEQRRNRNSCIIAYSLLAAPWSAASSAHGAQGAPAIKFGAGKGIRTPDFDLGKVALYH
jgi:hypothetical protein